MKDKQEPKILISLEEYKEFKKSKKYINELPFTIYLQSKPGGIETTQKIISSNEAIKNLNLDLYTIAEKTKKSIINYISNWSVKEFKEWKTYYEDDT